MRRVSSLCVTASAALGALLAPATVRADCYPPEPSPHVIDPALKMTDWTPPVLQPYPTVVISRGHSSPGAEGCGGGDPGCDGFGAIRLVPAAADDMTPADKMGYRLSLFAGPLPAGLVLPTDPVVVPPGESGFVLAWNDGATDRQEALSFSIGVVAIDLAGNESVLQTASVRDVDGRITTTYSDGNCRISSNDTSLRSLLVMAFLAAMAIFRARARR